MFPGAGREMEHKPVVALDASLAGGTSTGDSRYWTGLIRALSQLDTGLDIVLLTNGEPHFELPGPHARVVALPAASPRWYSLIGWPLAAKRARAEVFHTQYSLSPLIDHGGVTTIHDVSFFVGPEWFRPRDRLLLTRSIPSTVRRAARVITVSETSRREIEHFIPAAIGKTVAIPNALDDGFAPPSREVARTQVQADFGIDLPYALTIGTRWPRKNMDLAVQAVLKLEIDLELVVTGKPGWGPELSHPRIRRVGYVSDAQLAALYAAAEVYLAPSRHEGFGIPLLESWAARTPVIASSGGALPEVAGEAAVIVPSWEAEAWAQAITSLLSDSTKIERLKSLGTERLREFSWQRTAEATAAVYAALVP